MARNINKIRRKFEMRRREIRSKARKRTDPQIFPSHDESRDEPNFYLYQEQENHKKMVEKDWFILRTMIAVVVFFLVAILFQNHSPQFEQLRQLVRSAFEQEINFAAISHWYESQFGRPLSLIPAKSEVAMGDVEGKREMAYAVPVSGQIRESFEENGTGILIETEENAYVEAVRSGMVISVGEKENIGKTVGIEHYDGSQSWYGMLEEVEVKLYDHVETGKLVGKVTNEGGKGIFYFSIKQGDQYINPNDVISFE